MSYSKRIVLLSFLILTTSASSIAQDRFFVYLADKDNSQYSTGNPEAFLSQRALDRRSKASISITQEDLPVNKAYIDEIVSLDVEVYYASKWLNGLIIQTDNSKIPALENLAFVDSVVYIAPGVRLTKQRETYQIPDNFTSPASIDANSDLQLGIMNIQSMHQDGYTGEGMIIAVFDGGFTGANLYTPMADVFTEGRFLGGEDLVTFGGNPFQYSGHGASVWSTIASNIPELVGVAYDASFLLYITEDVKSEYRIEEYNWLIAAEKADSAGADIIQTSLGYSLFSSGSNMDYSYSDLDGQTAVITYAANKAFDKGMVIVTSAGNEGDDPWHYITAPADGIFVIAVGSIDSDYSQSVFSSFGPSYDGRIKPDVMTLGRGVALMAYDGGIEASNGTSYASPQVAGFVAGIWQANPDWTNKDVVRALRVTSSLSANPNNSLGYGVPNYEHAVVGGILNLTDIIADNIKVYPNPLSDDKLYIDISHRLVPDLLTIELYDARGSHLKSQYFDTNNKDILEVAQLGDLNNGIYLLSLRADDFYKTITLIKE